MRRCPIVLACWLVLTWAGLLPLYADEPAKATQEDDGHSQVAQQPLPSTVAGSNLWHYGAYADVAYILNFNFPDNHLWRNRTTAFRHNEFAPNMALAYVRKDVTDASRWGMELGVQGGYDSQNFAFLPGER
ncbi:MAG: porin, partial [Nitrospirota bacterium]|nr:porin [Nitrospirota bacterium]